MNVDWCRNARSHTVIIGRSPTEPPKQFVQKAVAFHQTVYTHIQRKYTPNGTTHLLSTSLPRLHRRGPTERLCPQHAAPTRLIDARVLEYFAQLFADCWCQYATKNTEGSFKQLDPIFDIHCNLPSLPLTVPPTPKRCVAHSPAFAFHAGDGKFSPFKLPASAAPAPPA